MTTLEMEVDQVAVDHVVGTAVVILTEKDGDRALPLWVGHVEAAGIISELREIPMARPTTYDLLHEAIFRLRAEVERVVVTDFQNGTFFAEVVLRTDGGEVRLDSRPSDAIALALRSKSPVFAESQLLEAEWCLEAVQRLLGERRKPRVVTDVGPDQYESLLSTLEDEDFGKWKM